MQFTSWASSGSATPTTWRARRSSRSTPRPRSGCSTARGSSTRSTSRPTPACQPDELATAIQPILRPGRRGADRRERRPQQAARQSSRRSRSSTIALLVFAGIALFVGVFIIFNTFSIIVAQRTRELALLRALGASGGRSRSSVAREALVVGLVASVVGIGLGVRSSRSGCRPCSALGHRPCRRPPLQFLPRTIIAALLVGLVTTLVASIVRARRASRVPPMAALRDAERRCPRRLAAGPIVGRVVPAVGVRLAAARPVRRGQRARARRPRRGHSSSSAWPSLSPLIAGRWPGDRRAAGRAVRRIPGSSAGRTPCATRGGPRRRRPRS